jgi:hypothetical protein
MLKRDVVEHLKLTELSAAVVDAFSKQFSRY